MRRNISHLRKAGPLLRLLRCGPDGYLLSLSPTKWGLQREGKDLEHVNRKEEVASKFWYELIEKLPGNVYGVYPFRSVAKGLVHDGSDILVIDRIADVVDDLTGGHFEMIKGIDNMGLLPIFCQTRDKANSEGGYHAAHPHAL